MVRTYVNTYATCSVLPLPNLLSQNVCDNFLVGDSAIILNRVPANLEEILNTLPNNRRYEYIHSRTMEYRHSIQERYDEQLDNIELVRQTQAEEQKRVEAELRRLESEKQAQEAQLQRLRRVIDELRPSDDDNNKKRPSDDDDNNSVNGIISAPDF